MRRFLDSLLPATSAAVVVALGSACSVIDDTVGGYLEPLTAQLVVVAAVEPEDETLAAWVPSSLVALAQVSKASLTTELSDLAVDDARVDVRVGDHGTWSLTPLGEDGVYEALLTDPALRFEQGRAHAFTVVAGDQTGTVSMPMPAAPTFDLPETVPAGEALSVSLQGGPYQAIAVTVIDATGTLTYSNEPDTADEFLDWIEGEAADQVQVPPEAFPEPASLYAVGIAGLVAADDSAFEGLNIAASHYLSGAMRFQAVATQ